MSAEGGPLDGAPWPEKLTARVVTPGASPAILGYDAEADLARHYAFAEVVFLALSGDLPTRAQGRAFEVALVFASPAPVNEAPTHAAVLARVCAASPGAILATAAIGLAEQARETVASLGAWLAWLDDPRGEPPPGFGAHSGEERASVDRLRGALAGTIEVPALGRDPGRTAAVVATLHACGLRDAARLQAALVFARLPIAFAEALATPPVSHRDYPLHLPPIAYAEPP